MKSTKKTKVTLAVTFPLLPADWTPAELLKMLRDTVQDRVTQLGLTELQEFTMRVASTVEETVYDASVGGRRGGKRDERLRTD